MFEQFSLSGKAAKRIGNYLQHAAELAGIDIHNSRLVFTLNNGQLVLNLYELGRPIQRIELRDVTSHFSIDYTEQLPMTLRDYMEGLSSAHEIPRENIRVVIMQKKDSLAGLFLFNNTSKVLTLDLLQLINLLNRGN